MRFLDLGLSSGPFGPRRFPPPRILPRPQDLRGTFHHLPGGPPGDSSSSSRAAVSTNLQEPSGGAEPAGIALGEIRATQDEYAEFFGSVFDQLQGCRWSSCAAQVPGRPQATERGVRRNGDRLPRGVPAARSTSSSSCTVNCRPIGRSRGKAGRKSAPAAGSSSSRPASSRPSGSSSAGPASRTRGPSACCAYEQAQR